MCSDLCRKLPTHLFVLAALFSPLAGALPKPHVVVFGKWTSAKWYVGPADNQPLELKVRPLYVDTRLKEYTTGAPHEVTDRLFVVRRVFRLNDVLPGEPSSAPRWLWQRGGWLLVDRVTGRVAQLGRRKPILRKPLGEPEGDDLPDSECPAPAWQRQPTRVTFEPDDTRKLTFSIRGHAVDVVNDAEEEDPEE